MKDYSPKRRTALVLAGTGTSGAYHAGAVKALDESGVKVDLVVGSGAGTVGAAYCAVLGGAKLHEPGGFWRGVRFASFYRLRPAVATAVALLTASFGVFLLPLALALVTGLLFPLVLIADLIFPGAPSRRLASLWAPPGTLAGPYLATLAVPIFALSILAVGFLARAWLRDRRRVAETFETFWDARPAQDRLRAGLWAIARGPAPQAAPPSEEELSRRYVALAAENLGQPGFRELILRTADLENGSVLPFVLLAEAHRTAFVRAYGRGSGTGPSGLRMFIDLRAPGYDTLLFPAVATGVLPPAVGPLRRVSFPKGGLHGGETHRLTDVTLLGGCGLSEAVAAGAQQIIVVAGTPADVSIGPRRRGVQARLDGTLAALERDGVAGDLRRAERMNRIVETLGHRLEGGDRVWEDPASGRLFRDVALYVIQPEKRSLMPLDLEGARDPATEVLATTDDLIEQGYRDTYRLFVEPVVGATPAPARTVPDREGQALEL